MIKARIALVSILLLAGVVRLYRLSDVPPSLNWDEVSHGYNAYSVLKTGSDEWGQPWPLTNFRAYGDYPLPLNVYLTIPAIAVFGLNAFAIRLPSALSGSLLVIPVYLLALAITRRKRQALLAAVLVAISPWAVLPSRGVFQSTVALFFFTLSLSLLVWANKRPILFLFSVAAYALSAYAYHNSRIVTLLFLPLFILYFIKVVKLSLLQGRFLLYGCFVFGVLLVPAWASVFSPTGSARANWVFILDQGVINTLSELRNQSPLPNLLKRAIYNRPIYFVVSFAKNYVDYLKPGFLFLSGGTQYQYSVPDFGLLPPVLLPFFYLGLVATLLSLIRRGISWQMLAVLAVLVLGPVPAAITRDRFQVLRSTLMFPPVIIYVVVGVGIVIGWTRKFNQKIQVATCFLFAVLLVIPTMVYLSNLFSNYSVNYSWAWQYGYQQVVSEVRLNYGKYDHFYLTKKYGEPHEFLLFYWPWNPASYKNDTKLVRYFRSDWYWIDAFDKFTFVNDWEIKDLKSDQFPPGRVLLVTSPGNFIVGKRIETINFLDGTPAFDIVKI